MVHTKLERLIKVVILDGHRWVQLIHPIIRDVSRQSGQPKVRQCLKSVGCVNLSVDIGKDRSLGVGPHQRVIALSERVCITVIGQGV